MTNFDVSENALTSFPMELSNFCVFDDKIREVRVDHNRIGGTVPAAVTGYANLKTLDASHNRHVFVLWWRVLQ